MGRADLINGIEEHPLLGSTGRYGPKYSTLQLQRYIGGIPYRKRVTKREPCYYESIL